MGAKLLSETVYGSDLTFVKFNSKNVIEDWKYLSDA